MAFAQFNQTIAGIRYAAGSYTKGQYSPGAETPIEIQASVQPLAGRELDILPEGRKELESYKVYTTFELRAANQNNQTQSDEITLFGKSFEVIKVENWQNAVIPHYKALVTLKKR